MSKSGRSIRPAEQLALLADVAHRVLGERLERLAELQPLPVVRVPHRVELLHLALEERLAVAQHRRRRGP